MEANVTGSLKNDLFLKNFYNFEEEDEDEDNDEERHAEVIKYYQQQFEKHNQNTSSSKVDKVVAATNTNKRKYQNNDSNDYHIHEEDDSGEIEEQNYKNVRRVRRQAAREIISYEWLKNDNSFISVNSSDEAVSRDDYTLFSNGTIKFMSNNSSTGVYKCRVKYWYITNKDIEIGPAISTSTKVELAGEFFLFFIPFLWNLQS